MAARSLLALAALVHATRAGLCACLERTLPASAGALYCAPASDCGLGGVCGAGAEGHACAASTGASWGANASALENATAFTSALLFTVASASAPADEYGTLEYRRGDADALEAALSLVLADATRLRLRILIVDAATRPCPFALPDDRCAPAISLAPLGNCTLELAENTWTLLAAAASVHVRVRGQRRCATSEPSDGGVALVALLAGTGALLVALLAGGAWLRRGPEETPFATLDRRDAHQPAQRVRAHADDGTSPKKQRKQKQPAPVDAVVEEAPTPPTRPSVPAPGAPVVAPPPLLPLPLAAPREEPPALPPLLVLVTELPAEDAPAALLPPPPPPLPASPAPRHVPAGARAKEAARQRAAAPLTPEELLALAHQPITRELQAHLPEERRPSRHRVRKPAPKPAIYDRIELVAPSVAVVQYSELPPDNPKFNPLAVL